MKRAGIGASIGRRGDEQYLTGEAQYTDDIAIVGAAHMAVVRSPHAHAHIEDIDTAAAERLDGVRTVYTAADLQTSGVPGTIPPETPLPGPEEMDAPIHVERELAAPDRPLLAGEKVRFVGDPVAVVLADSKYVARDAVDLVDVSYDPLPATIHPTEAIAGDAQRLFDSVEDNVAFEWACGDETAVASAFETADETVEVELDHQRLIANAIEPRAAVASFDKATGTLDVWRPTQGVHKHRDILAEMLDFHPSDVRVRTPAVGGSFGNKSKAYPAECLVAWCAWQAEVPVRWQATRSEMYHSGAHGRGHESSASLAFDADGTLRGLQVESVANVGAYLCGPATLIHTLALSGGLSGQYRIPAIHCRVTARYTNTSPVSSYRGTSRPRAVMIVERLIEKAARELGIDPLELRERNVIPPEAFPYETPLGDTYDSGEYGRALERACDIVGYAEQRSLQADLRNEDCHLGIGISCCVDSAGGMPEHCRLEIDSTGTVTASVGTLDTGQGHTTSIGQILTEELGVPAEDIEIEQRDSDVLPEGTGTFGSRSSVVTDRMLGSCAEELRETARQEAAEALAVSAAEIEFGDGEFVVSEDPGASISLQAIVARREEPLVATSADFHPQTSPFGTHIAVVEVNPDSGEIVLDRYVAVDDCGTQINPALVEGQILGGTVQGIGQAMAEQAVFDNDGRLRTDSMLEYALPRAADVPEMEHDTTETPSPYTPHGTKGIGESGPSAAPAAIANAVADALEPFGVTDVQLPITEADVLEITRGSP